MLAKKMEKSVNDLLHKARYPTPVRNDTILYTNGCYRGEQFRHDQNARKSRTRYRVHIPTKSLPPYLLLSSDLEDRTPRASSEVSKTAGPVPKSWRTVPREVRDKGTPEWRADALSLVLDELPANQTHAPPLTELCMGVLLDTFSALEDFEHLLLPLLPVRLRSLLQRYTAVHAPLSNPSLYALLGESGHLNGELIIVGPDASLGKDAVALKPPDRQIPADDSQDWESEDHFVDSFELQTLALISTNLSFQTLLTFPRSLTRLALVDISNPLPICQLPPLCPSIVVLDLSSNSWLKDPDQSHSVLGSVNWDKWNNLDILGLRDCSVCQDTLDRVNQNRWLDVQIILV
jgi:hypothetical protein